MRLADVAVAGVAFVYAGAMAMVGAIYISQGKTVGWCLVAGATLVVFSGLTVIRTAMLVDTVRDILTTLRRNK